MDPSLAALRSFVAVADAGSMARAAELLHVTTPALSQQITRLERQLGAVLFERTPSGAVVTPEGAHLAELSRRALDAYGDLLGWRDGMAARSSRDGSLTIAHVGSAARHVGAAATAELATRFAPRRLAWLASEPESALAALDDGTVAGVLVRDVDLDDSDRHASSTHRPRRSMVIGEPDAVVAVIGERSRLIAGSKTTAGELRALVFAANATPGSDLLSLHRLAPESCTAPERRRPVASLDEALALAAVAPIAVLTVASAAASAFVPGTRVVRITDIEPVMTRLIFTTSIDPGGDRSEGGD